MNIKDSLSKIPQQALKPEAKTLPEAEQNPQEIQQSHNPLPKYAMERKSIFTDHRGLLIAQVKDHTGEVIANYPSNEVIKRYHSLKENS